MAGYGGGSNPPGTADSIRGVGSDRVRVLHFTGVTADKAAIGMGGKLMGYTMRETTGSAGAVIELFDGGSTGGQSFLAQGLGNGNSNTVWFGDVGLDIESGIFMHNITGTADVWLYFRADIGYE